MGACRRQVGTIAADARRLIRLLLSYPSKRDRDDTSSPTDRLALDKVCCVAVETRDRPSRTEAEAAFRTIIRWSGDYLDRAGLIETPGHVARRFWRILH